MSCSLGSHARVLMTCSRQKRPIIPHQFNSHPFCLLCFPRVGGSALRFPRTYTWSPRGGPCNLRLTIVEGAWPRPSTCRVPRHLAHPLQPSRASTHFTLARYGPLVFVKAPIRSSAPFWSAKGNKHL
jgi:hypothetical protein